MGVKDIVGAIIKLLVLIFKTWLERDAEKKKQKQEAIKDVQNGIKEQDPAKITAGFDKHNNIS